MARLLSLRDEDYEDEVRQAPGPVLLEIWAPSCGPCQVQKPITERLAKELGDELLIGRINGQESTAFVTAYEVRAVPTILILFEGEVRHRLMGNQSYQELKALIAELVHPTPHEA